MIEASCFSPDSLGLWSSVVAPHLEAIRPLPEVEEGLRDPLASIDQLKRAVQVFEGMQPQGGPLHAAVVSILADSQHRKGKYREALSSLDTITPEGASNPLLPLIKLSKAKVQWYSGEFTEAVSTTEEVLDLDAVHASPSLRCAALNANALARLLRLVQDDRRGIDREDESDAINEGLRIASNTMIQQQRAGDRNQLMVAALLNNVGVAQMVTSRSTSKPALPMVMKSWYQALSTLQQSHPIQEHLFATPWLEAQVHLNMAWTLLHDMPKDKKDEEGLKMASDSTREAITLMEKWDSIEGQRTLHRALGLAARCYVQAGSAVTAEGLWQTIMGSEETRGVGPLHGLTYRDALSDFGQLCVNWDKRESEGEGLLQRSREVNNNLGQGWRDQPALLSGLWFYTLGQ